MNRARLKEGEREEEEKSHAKPCQKQSSKRRKKEEERSSLERKRDASKTTNKEAASERERDKGNKMCAWPTLILCSSSSIHPHSTAGSTFVSQCVSDVFWEEGGRRRRRSSPHTHKTVHSSET